MSTQGKRDYRPRVHFAPDRMWMNDPNGMVYIDGIYHFFYQHYPKEAKWGPMHWGHAVSKDLLHWEDLGSAIWPDELGYIFSGSCVYDSRNLSGYGKAGNMPLVAIYTSHREDGLEQQSIAYSTDGIHFEKSYQNPVIKNPGIPDFRDPKAFYNPVKDCYSLVLAAGDRVVFYESTNLKDWSKSGEFKPEGNCALGICECPDCFPVETKEGVKWVLIVSIIMTVADKRKHLHRTMYFVGDFDGTAFIPEKDWAEPKWLDEGPDNYAAVSFQNLGEPLIMGWACNWGYADRLPTGEYCGQATIARRIELAKTENGYRLVQTPVGLQHLKAASYQIENKARLYTEAFGLTVSGTGTGSITLSNAGGQKLVIAIGEDEITADRTCADDKAFHEFYGMPENCIFKAARYDRENVSLELLFDVSVAEIFSDGGKSSMTLLTFPDSPFDELTIEGKFQAMLYHIT